MNEIPKKEQTMNRRTFLKKSGKLYLGILATEKLEETGELSFVERVSSEGDWSRDFAIDPTGKFIIGSNQESGNLVLFARDGDTGKLTKLTVDIEVPYPVVMKFLK